MLTSMLGSWKEGGSNKKYGIGVTLREKGKTCCLQRIDTQSLWLLKKCTTQETISLLVG